MFVTADETIYMIGRRKDEEFERDEDDERERTQDKYIKVPGGSLRKLSKPEECKSIRKVAHFEEYVVLLTEAGKLYIHGVYEEDLFPIIDDEDGDEDGEEGNDDNQDADEVKKHDVRFKEVDIDSMFKTYKLDKDGKIVDIDVGADFEGEPMVSIVTK